jgi:hypothetical protein
MSRLRVGEAFAANRFAPLAFVLLLWLAVGRRRRGRSGPRGWTGGDVDPDAVRLAEAKQIGLGAEI